LPALLAEAERLGAGELRRRILEQLAETAPVADTDGPLSARELDVAALLAEGRTNREIASALFVSERTAQNHVQHILTKLGVANRTQAAAWYRERSFGDSG
jgi:DNA-binding NarL/FixJ family response regulator